MRMKDGLNGMPARFVGYHRTPTLDLEDTHLIIMRHLFSQYATNNMTVDFLYLWISFLIVKSHIIILQICCLSTVRCSAEYQ